VEEESARPEEIVDVWRDTSLAAELVDRLSESAIAPLTQAERNALAMEQIADLAEQAAQSTERAAKRARQAANEARRLADQARLEDRRVE
jgi:methyl-accepting chemotaxis protein